MDKRGRPEVAAAHRAQTRRTDDNNTISRAVGVVVSHPLSMREALGSIPRLSTFAAALDSPRAMRLAGRREKTRKENKTTPVGFEPTRGDPIGLAGRRLSHSAKVSLD